MLISSANLCVPVFSDRWLLVVKKATSVTQQKFQMLCVPIKHCQNGVLDLILSETIPHAFQILDYLIHAFHWQGYRTRFHATITEYKRKPVYRNESHMMAILF